MLGRLISRTLLTLAVLALAIYLMPWGLYGWGLQALPERREPAVAPPQLVSTYRHFLQKDPKAEFEPLSPWDPIVRLAKGGVPSPEADGSRLAGQAARVLLRRQPEHAGTLERHVREAAAAIWISRHWSADEAAATVVQEGDYGAPVAGLEAVSQLFFGMPAASLGPSEAAALVVLQKGPALYRCAPDRLAVPAAALLAEVAPGVSYAPAFAPEWLARCRTRP